MLEAESQKRKAVPEEQIVPEPLSKGLDLDDLTDDEPMINLDKPKNNKPVKKIGRRPLVRAREVPPAKVAEAPTPIKSSFELPPVFPEGASMDDLYSMLKFEISPEYVFFLWFVFVHLFSRASLHNQFLLAAMFKLFMNYVNKIENPVKKVRKDRDVETLALFFRAQLDVRLEQYFLQPSINFNLELWRQRLHQGCC